MPRSAEIFVRPFLCGASMLVALYCWGDSLAKPAGGSRPAEATSTWRRTAKGWEDRRGWLPPAPSFQPALSPVLVAAFQLLASLLALLAGDLRNDRRNLQQTCTESPTDCHYSWKPAAGPCPQQFAAA
jgi:hypothetical protein